jgi:hypothetical protein
MDDVVLLYLELINYTLNNSQENNRSKRILLN